MRRSARLHQASTRQKGCKCRSREKGWRLRLRILLPWYARCVELFMDLALTLPSLCSWRSACSWIRIRSKGRSSMSRCWKETSYARPEPGTPISETGCAKANSCTYSLGSFLAITAADIITFERRGFKANQVFVTVSQCWCVLPGAALPAYNPWLAKLDSTTVNSLGATGIELWA